MKNLLTTIAIAFLACLPISARAGGSITACGTTIPGTATGVYTVTANISGGSANCITVDASNITINLNSFVLTGNGAGKGIAIGSSSVANLTVENGTLKGFLTAIDTSANTVNAMTQVRNVTIRNSTGNGFTPGNIALITDSSFLNNGGWAVYGPNTANGTLIVNTIACGNVSGAFDLPTGTNDYAIYFSPVSSSC